MTIHRMFQLRISGAACVAAIVSSLLWAFHFVDSVSASDWPQLLGPNRDGVAVAETLLPKWDSQGPKVVWEKPVGAGFAGAAVSGDRAVVFVREGQDEIVRCYAAATGNVLWESKTPCNYQGGVSGDKGPRCVPLISGDHVFTFGVQGRLQCISLADGAQVWQRDTTADFKPLEGYFGVGSTPLLYKDQLIVNVGGRGDSSVVAFNVADGKTIWQIFTDAASYSSPIIVKAGGTDIAVVVTRLNVVGIDPAIGKLTFTIPFGARGPTVNGATPVVIGNKVFLTASYNIGSLLIELDKSSAKEIWRNEELLASQYATPVPAAPGSGIVFAVDGRQDSGSASLKCIDVGKQKVLWEETGFDYGTLIRVDQDLLVLTCSGELIRVAASLDGYKELSRAKVLRTTDSGYRLPALSNGRLFVRDDTTFKCLEVGKAN